MRHDLRMRAGRFAWILIAALALSVTNAAAQPDASRADEHATAPSAKTRSQGVAVLGAGASRDEASALARSVYASSLRPRGLDELRARVLAGDPAPPTSTKEIHDLAELRAGVAGDDAASRQVLAGIARQLNVQALLVVSVAPTAPLEDAGADAGAPTAVPSARLFLADTGDFDAARYEPDSAGGWRGTVTSLAGRFPPPPAPGFEPRGLPAAPKLAPGKEDRPFYASPWLWGALGAAALVGGFFFFIGQDSGDDPIHLQMRVPRP